MECSIKKNGQWVVLTVKGVINIETAEELKTVFDDLLAKGSNYIRLNLKQVPISNSSGIGNILMLYKKLKERGGSLEIKGVSSNLMEMLKLLKVDQLITIHR
jgi:anti-sigma B factor antagonist